MRVSNSLGAGRPRSARRATAVSLLLTCCLEAAAGGVTVLTRHSLPYLFTDVSAVVELTAGLLPIFALSLPGDGVNAVLQGLLRGECLGRECLRGVLWDMLGVMWGVMRSMLGVQVAMLGVLGMKRG